MKPEFVIIYFVVINLIGAFLNIADKYKAKYNKWRIKESTLWLIGLFGGAPASYLTMLLIRHKTKHKSFMFGMPVLIILNIAEFVFLYKICL